MKKIDKALSTAEESVSHWAKVKIPGNAGTPPPIDIIVSGIRRSRTIERLLLGRNVVRFVIDEAHCFSSWGQDFRVDYFYIGDYIKSYQERKVFRKGFLFLVLRHSQTEGDRRYPGLFQGKVISGFGSL